MGIVRAARVGTDGQIFLPGDVRCRWSEREVTVADLGESVLVQPSPPPGTPVSAGLTPPKG